MKRSTKYTLAVTAVLATIGFVLKSDLGPFALGFFLFTLSAQLGPKLYLQSLTNNRTFYCLLFVLIGTYISVLALILAGYPMPGFLVATILCGLLIGLRVI